MSYGKLSVFVGPMWAGKSTELLKRVLWAKNGEKKAVLVLKPSFDDRYDKSNVVSHDGLSCDARPISQWDDRLQNICNDAEIICFDEIQFFEAPRFQGDIIAHVSELLKLGKTVWCAGLDMDAEGNPFRVSAMLSAMADECLKLKANCTVCGRHASKTYRKVAGETVELGSEDKYEARCNDHWGM